MTCDFLTLLGLGYLLQLKSETVASLEGLLIDRANF